MPAQERLVLVSEIPQTGRMSVFVDDTPALLLSSGGKFFCIEDVCSHDGQPLTNGPLEGCAIVCPRHGAKFDLATGKALCMPATDGIRSFPVIERDGVLYAEY